MLFISNIKSCVDGVYVLFIKVESTTGCQALKKRLKGQLIQCVNGDIQKHNTVLS